MIKKLLSCFLLATALALASASAVGPIISPPSQIGTGAGTSLTLGGASAFSSAPFSVRVATDLNLHVFSSSGYLGLLAENNANNNQAGLQLNGSIIWLNTTNIILGSGGGTIGFSGAAPTIASATTIGPSTPIVFISGTTPIATITAPYPFGFGGGQITLIPTGIFTTTTGGNIALASTAVVNKALIMTYDATTTKWYPSY